MFLFCATDAGGARELLPVIAEATKQGAPLRVFASAVTAPILSGEIICCTSAKEASSLLKDIQPSVVILGTTGIMSPERLLTMAAKAQNIPTVVVLDEWYNYALRFTDGEGALGPHLPDMIAVQDELSVTLATEEGLPKDILAVTGSPALAEYTKRALVFASNPPPKPAMMVNPEMPTILFLSQPLKALYGGAPGEKGSYGEFLGFNEETVRKDLHDALFAVKHPVRVIEKLHPSEPEKLPPPMPSNVVWQIEREKDSLWPLLWHCDVIIGMNTKALLEAAILGRRGISYQPDAIRPMLCTAALLGLAELQTTKANLLERLPERLLSPRPKLDPLELPCAPKDAAARVLLAAMKLTESRKV